LTDLGTIQYDLLLFCLAFFRAAFLPVQKFMEVYRHGLSDRNSRTNDRMRFQQSVAASVAPLLSQ